MTLPNRRLLAFAALIIASSIWGINNSVMKITLETVPVFTLAYIRFTAAAIILFPFVAGKLTIQRNDLPKVILAGLCAVTLNISFFFWGIKLTTALNAAIISASMPIFTLLFARLFLKEVISSKLLVAAILGTLGIGIVIGRDILDHGFTLSPLGDLLVLLATIAFVCYETIGKKLTQSYSSSVLTFYFFLVGSFSFLPLAIAELLKNPNWTDVLQKSSYMGIFYGIFFSSLSAYSLWSWGLSKIPESRVGFFFYFDPIVATITAVLLLSEKVTAPFLLGALLIFAGIFIAEGRLPYHHMHHHIQKSGKK